MTSVYFEAWGFTLVHFCWQAAVLAGLYKLIDILAPNMRNASRYVLGLAALIAMAALAGATFVYEVLRLTPDAVAPVSGHGQAVSTSLLPAIGADTVLTMRALLPWLDAAWLLGVIGLSLRMLGGLWLIHRLKAAAQPVPEALANRFAWAVRRLGLTGKVKLRLHPHITGPFVIGALRSVIYLPLSAVTALSPEQLDAVLAHELEHIRRADYVWNLVQSLIETVFFFHPAVWWLGSRLREQRELCCDDAALKTCTDPLTYATALLSLEEQRRSAPRLAMALNGQGEGKSLVGRIARILGEKVTLPRGKTRPHVALALPVILLMLGVFITPVAQVAASSAKAKAEIAAAATAADCPIEPKDAHPGQSKTRHDLADAADQDKTHKRWAFASEDGEWQAEFDGIDPDAIAEQVRADLMAAKADIRAHNDVDPDAIAAEVKADMQRAKADMERQGIMNHGIDPDAIAEQVRNDTMRARNDMARLDDIDPDAMAEQARADAQRAKDDMRRARRMTPPAAPEPPEAPEAPEAYDEVPAPLAEPAPMPAPAAAPAPAPMSQLVPPTPPVPPVNVKVKSKVKMKSVAVNIADS